MFKVAVCGDVGFVLEPPFVLLKIKFYAAMLLTVVYGIVIYGCARPALFLADVVLL